MEFRIWHANYKFVKYDIIKLVKYDIILGLGTIYEKVWGQKYALIYLFMIL